MLAKLVSAFVATLPRVGHNYTALAGLLLIIVLGWLNILPSETVVSVCSSLFTVSLL